MVDPQFSRGTPQVRSFPSPFESAPAESKSEAPARASTRRPAYSYIVHGVLLVATFLSTTAFGVVLQDSFESGLPLGTHGFFFGYVQLFHLQGNYWRGLSFSLPLLAILLAHELGHFFACQRWRVDATLPYFLPSPALLGTFGAFIKIRAPIYTRRILFDIGASGPFAGFVFLVPFLIAGMVYSRLSAAPLHGEYVFSTPLILRLAEWVRFPHVAPNLIVLHPMAVAAWAGLLATAINLLPMGQLDGGHILYSVLGTRGHRIVSTICVGVLAVLGYFYYAWWAWALLMFFFGRRHPLIYDNTPIRGARLLLACFALVLFVLSFSVVPVTKR